MDKTFTQTVKHYFEYLIREYGFELLTSAESSRGHVGEGRVVYVTKLTLVDINCTRGEAPLIYIGRIKDHGKHPITLDLLYEYLNLSNEEKKNIPTHVSDREQLIKVSQILSTRPIPHYVSINHDTVGKIEHELIEYTRYLRLYADSFLRGDFSHWLEIFNYQVIKMRTDFIRSGKDELVLYQVGLDDRGKPIYKKRFVFQDSMNYLEELKKEYQQS